MVVTNVGIVPLVIMLMNVEKAVLGDSIVFLTTVGTSVQVGASDHAWVFAAVSEGLMKGSDMRASIGEAVGSWIAVSVLESESNYK